MKSFSFNIIDFHQFSSIFFYFLTFPCYKEANDVKLTQSLPPPPPQNLPLISSVLLGLKSVLYPPVEAYSAPSQISQMERLQTYFFNKNFCSRYNLTSMLNKATCYKNPYKTIYVDLILKNCPGPFQNSCVVETGLSDFHKMVVTVMKTSY